MATKNLSTNEAHDALLTRTDVESVKIIGKPARRNSPARVRIVVYRKDLPPLARTAPTTDAAMLAVYMGITFNGLAI